VALSRPRTLVLRALGLGDFLTGVPALRAVRRARPDHLLVLAAPAALEPLVRLSGVADELLDTRGLDALPRDGPPPGLAVNLHGAGPESHRLLRATGAEELVAFACPAAGHAGPAWSADEHEVVRWCRLVADSLDVVAEPDDLALDVPPPTVAAGAVVIHPGAAYGARRWPPERYAQVARRLAEQGHDVVVSGGPGEEELAADVVDRAGLPDSAVLAGPDLPLDALAALVAHARLVVSGDTGVAHLASAYATPSVLLFGPTSPARWGPPARGPHTVLWHGDGSGDPWAATCDPALLRVGVVEVLAAVQQQVEGSVSA